MAVEVKNTFIQINTEEFGDLGFKRQQSAPATNASADQQWARNVSCDTEVGPERLSETGSDSSWEDDAETQQFPWARVVTGDQFEYHAADCTVNAKQSVAISSHLGAGRHPHVARFNEHEAYVKHAAEAQQLYFQHSELANSPAASFPAVGEAHEQYNCFSTSPPGSPSATPYPYPTVGALGEAQEQYYSVSASSTSPCLPVGDAQEQYHCVPTSPTSRHPPDGEAHEQYHCMSTSPTSSYPPVGAASWQTPKPLPYAERLGEAQKPYPCDSASPTYPHQSVEHSPPKAVSEGSVDGFTVMVRNIPNKYSRDLFVQELDHTGFQGTYDFVYLPIDPQTRANKGYAFVNFVQSYHWAKSFMQMWEQRKMNLFESEKRIRVIPAIMQGFEANYAHYAQKYVSREDEKMRPLFLRKPNATAEIPPPPSTKPLLEKAAVAPAVPLIGAAKKTPDQTKKHKAERQSRKVSLIDQAAHAANTQAWEKSKRENAALGPNSAAQVPNSAGQGYQEGFAPWARSDFQAPGSQQVNTQSVASAGFKFCPWCGAKAKVSFQFCQVCGKRY